VRLRRARVLPGRQRHPAVTVDDAGLHFQQSFSGSLDVVMDGQRVWSFGTSDAESSVTSVEWPKRLSRRLEGTADVRIVAGDAELFAGSVTFGSGAGRPRFVDNHGIPIFIDKWGLIQRPFDGRREAGVVDAMVDMARRVLEIMRDECGIDGWLSFGTLLGAAREGRAIGHDSDVDLNYLSEKQTPAEMAVELWDIGRALRRAGLTVQHRSASFVTVRFPVPDGGQGNLDVYTCFYVEDRLHETATVREVVPREAILPLHDVPFEGHRLPAPADPDRLLAVSYGPQWRVPDPSVRHLPGPDITQRFDGWFGSLMKGRRDWSAYNTRVAAEGGRASRFSRWVAAQLEGVDRVIEVGHGAGFDLVTYAGDGRRVIGLDYAPPRRRAPYAGLEQVLTREFSLDDLRDVLTLGVQLARRDTEQAMVARRLFEALTPDSSEAFVSFCATALRRGGRAYLEGVARTPRGAHAWQARHETGRIRSLDPARVATQVEAAGGRIVSRAGFDEAARAVRTGPPATWRMTVEWGPTGRSRR
jgi:SAM-dependent methyltransferase